MPLLLLERQILLFTVVSRQPRESLPLQQSVSHSGGGGRVCDSGTDIALSVSESTLAAVGRKRDSYSLACMPWPTYSVARVKRLLAGNT